MDATTTQPVTDATTYWATRHRTYGPGWCECYWYDWQAPHRTALVDVLRGLAPFDSLLEVGCGPGPNLRRFRAAFPEAVLYGVDINPEAVAFAARQFADDPSVAVQCLDLHRLDVVPPVDVVCTCYALAYVAPSALPDVLSRLIRATRRALVLAEPLGRFTRVPSLPYPEWRHDYYTLLSLGACEGLTTVTRLPCPADRLDGLVVWKRS